MIPQDWCSPSGDPSGPPLRNLLSIINHCPEDLVEVTWHMGFDFLTAVGDDMKREMVDEYKELDELLTDKKRFPHMGDVFITFFIVLCDRNDLCVGSSREVIAKGCETRLQAELVHLSKGDIRLTVKCLEIK